MKPEIVHEKGYDFQKAKDNRITKCNHVANKELCDDCIEKMKKQITSVRSVSDVLQLIEKASCHIGDLCQGTRRWTMSVPVDEENDSDCVLQTALTEAKKLIEEMG